MKIPQETIDRLLKDQKNQCEFCWQPIPPYHVHHAVMTREKKFAKWLDMLENLVLVCPICHGNHGHLSNWFMRCVVWSRKIDRGYDMQGWLDSIPMRSKERFEYFDGNYQSNTFLSKLNWNKK